MKISKPKLSTIIPSRKWHVRLFVLVAFIILAVSQPYLAPLNIFRQIMLLIGYVLIVAGAFGRVYCLAFIGGRKNKSLIKEGPFSVVRNPLYLCSFIAAFGIGLQSGSVTMTLLLPGALIAYYGLAVRKEEVVLSEIFGEEYRAYKKQVPRWMPKCSLRSEPDTFDMKPRFLRRAITEASAFFLALPLLVTISALQAYRILPAWLILP